MGLFDDILAKASEITGVGDVLNQASDTVSQTAEDAVASATDQAQAAVDQLPADSTDITGLGDSKPE